MTETLANGYSSESTPMNTNMTRFRGFSKKSLHLCALEESNLSIVKRLSIQLIFFHQGHQDLIGRIRPLQFNYLPYKLFLEKKSCQTPKKKKEKKSHLWCLTDESGFENFCQTPKKKKKKVQV